MQANGLKPSLLRLKVLNALIDCEHEAPEAVPIHGVYERLGPGGEALSLNSVYQVLRRLGEHGVVLHQRDGYRLHPQSRGRLSLSH